MAAMGARHWHVGSPADAARAKLMLQIMMGSMIGALAETLALTEKAGLDPAQVMDMFNSSAMANPISAAKGELMADKTYYPPNFQIYLQQKDLRLALALADKLGMAAPIAATVNSQYVAARQQGLADADFAAVREVYSASPPSNVS
jgi:glyoxylate/succinic semialdehyde reductase